MKTYREIALQNFNEALFSLENSMYSVAAYLFQQYAEKSAKALLEKKDPENKFLKSHVIESILAAYDPINKTGENADKSRYLTSLYFNTSYPGDYYFDAEEVHVKQAHAYAMDLEVYFKAELERLEKASSSLDLAIDSLPDINIPD